MRFLHLVFVLIAGLTALVSEGHRDLLFLLSSKRAHEARILDQRALFPRGAQYYGVTAALPGGRQVTPDADFPGWLKTPQKDDTFVLLCLNSAETWCRPSGFYFLLWPVIWKFTPFLTGLLLLPTFMQVWLARLSVRWTASLAAALLPTHEVSGK